MEIRTILHSELDCHLKPDIALLKQAVQEIGNREDVNLKADVFRAFFDKTIKTSALIDKEAELSEKIKASKDESEKEKLKQEKASVSSKVDGGLAGALELLMEAGMIDCYHYNYDDHFNMIVAGLMGSTCYMKEDFKALQDKKISNIMTIANVVLNNGHHSTFGHSHITLEITGIPKALAMILNNEKEYTTSEKSARYTVIDQISDDELLLYEKWKEIFTKLIDEKYGANQPFFDAKGVKTAKLAQENARYMISAFTPTNMVYTTSFRQLNYLAHWLRNELNNPNSNKFYMGVKNEMLEFINFVKDQKIYSENLEDHKDRKLSLFGPGVLGEDITSERYTLNYYTSIAALAQAHRHRTLHYRINEYMFNNEPSNYFMPPILANSGNKELIYEWFNDIRSVEEKIPQGQLVNVIENGDTNDFILKAKERECSEAQWEIMDLTRRYSKRFSAALGEELERANVKAEFLKGLREGDLLNTIESIKEKKELFDQLSTGARCTAGYKCTRPCGFKEGINLERDI